MANRPSKPPRDPRPAAPSGNPEAAEGAHATPGGNSEPAKGAQATPADGYTETTNGVRISVRSFYLADQSDPDEGKFVWAYRIKIENLGRETVQLLKRTWRITDARGRTQRVHGDGVVGHQPVLEPGEAFEYTSGTPLETPSGFMTGTYHMIISDSGEAFDVAIPTFSLDSPHQSGGLH